MKIGFVSEETSRLIYDVVYKNERFPWFFTEHAVNRTYKNNYSGFLHIFLDENKQESSLLPITLNLASEILTILNIPNEKIKRCLRLRANLLTPLKNEYNKEDYIHVDATEDNYITIVYYVNDADGPTKLYDNDNNEVDAVEPQQGKFVMFKSNTKHAAILPTESSRRCSIVIILELTEIL